MNTNSETNGSKQRRIKSVLNILPYIEMKSNKEITIEGCKGILEYNDETIRINTMGGMVLVFKGRGLNILCMTASGIIIGGFVLSVEFVC